MDALTQAQIAHDFRAPTAYAPASGVYEFDAHWRNIPVICRVTVQRDTAQELLALMVDGWSMQHGGYELFDLGALLKPDEERALLALFDPIKASYVAPLEDD